MQTHSDTVTHALTTTNQNKTNVEGFLKRLRYSNNLWQIQLITYATIGNGRIFSLSWYLQQFNKILSHSFLITELESFFKSIKD